MRSAKRSANLPAAFVLGGGANGLGVVRELGPLGITSVVFDHNPGNLAFLSRYAHRRVLVDFAHRDQIVAQLCNCADGLTIKPILIICSDEFLALVSEHHSVLAEKVHFVLPEPSIVRTVLSKREFGLFAWNGDLPIARSLDGDSLSVGTLDAAETPSLSFPLVVKPIRSGGWLKDTALGSVAALKAVYIGDQQALQDFSTKYPSALASATLQEYIPGADSDHYSYMAFIDANGEERIGFGVRKLRVNPIHAGVATFCEVSTDPALTDAGRTIIQALRYRGAVSVCFKHCSIRKKYLCYEVNGRFPLAHTAGTLIGLSLARIAYAVTADRPLLPQTSRMHPTGKWLRLAGDLSAFRAYRVAGELSTWQWLTSLRDTRFLCEWSWRDPAPLLVDSTRRLLRSARGNFTRAIAAVSRKAS